jgi:AraC-like DNA-binding protein
MSTKRRTPQSPDNPPWVWGWNSPLPEVPALAHFNEAKSPPGYVLPPHRHATVEVCLIVAGRAHWQNPDGEFTLGAGDLYLIGANEEHNGRSDERDPQHNFAIGFDLGRLVARLGDPGQSAEEARAVDALLPRRRVIPGAANTARIFTAIRHELEHLPPPSAPGRGLAVVMIQALLVELAVTVTRLVIEARDGFEAMPPSRAAIRQVAERLRGTLGDPPTLAEMAEWAGMSPGHLAVAFKREFGRTPLEHLTTLRIEAASTRLREDRRASITDIALDLGFCSSQYFSEVFKRVTGQTPSGWRDG